MRARPSLAVSFARARRQGPKRQIWNHPLALPAALIEYDLVRAAEHTFHGFEIESFARHLGRFLVLRIDLVEAGNLTGCLRDRLELVAFRLLDNRRGLAPRLGNDPVGIGLGLVAQTVLILLRRDHVLEGGDDLLRRVDGLQLHLQHQNPGLVPIQDVLHDFLHARLDLWTFDSQNWQALVRQVERNLRIRLAHALTHAETDIDRVAIGDWELLHAADGDRQVVVQPRPGFARVTAENPVQPDF